MTRNDIIIAKLAYLTVAASENGTHIDFAISARDFQFVL